ncbi:anti-sigma factor [Pseudomonas akapageensis]|uniref:anti-sigma factor n=1 Tax=Pseudomonas akapageensis TaxID=2609961 RepID=UPI00140AF030|nr:anti-sigma factor [Pseudomonas akapageensis]
MNYRSASVRRALAADYTIGLMPSTARRRFERLMLEDPALRAEVAKWQETLIGLTAPLAEQRVHPRVWKAIEARIFTQKSQAAAKHSFWYWLRWTATAGVLVVLVTLGIRLTPDGPLHTTTLLADNQQAALQIKTYEDHLEVTAIALAAPGANKSLELWAISADGKPTSLGVLPDAGSTRLPLTEPQQALLTNAKALAVSLEPHLGSPTGQPTGPVLYQGKIETL